MQSDLGFNWGKVVTFFFIINILLIGLILVTNNKNNQASTRIRASSEKKPKASSSNSGVRKFRETSKYQVVDTLERESHFSDSVKDEKDLVFGEQPSEGNDSKPITSKVDSIPIEISDSTRNKPKWYQFKKRKEWKRRVKAEQ